MRKPNGASRRSARKLPKGAVGYVVRDEDGLLWVAVEHMPAGESEDGCLAARVVNGLPQWRRTRHLIHYEVIGQYDGQCLHPSELKPLTPDDEHCDNRLAGVFTGIAPGFD